MSTWEKKRLSNRLPVAKQGLPFICVAVGLTLFFVWAGLLLLAIIAGILSLFVIFFFRDPEREIEVQEKAVLTPADGKIVAIQHLKDPDNLLGEPAVKVSIFMSIFSVHVNRIPAGGRILKIAYHSGKFFSANLDKASEQNENNKITLQTEDGQKIVFVQIAGLIARRIVCWVKEEDMVRAGQRFGLIRFGSRLDVYLPGDSRVTVEPSNRVKAGKTILGYLS